METEQGSSNHECSQKHTKVMRKRGVENGKHNVLRTEVAPRRDVHYSSTWLYKKRAAAAASIPAHPLRCPNNSPPCPPLSLGSSPAPPVRSCAPVCSCLCCCGKRKHSGRGRARLSPLSLKTNTPQLQRKRDLREYPPAFLRCGLISSLARIGAVLTRGGDWEECSPNPKAPAASTLWISSRIQKKKTKRDAVR